MNSKKNIPSFKMDGVGDPCTSSQYTLLREMYEYITHGNELKIKCLQFQDKNTLEISLWTPELNRSNQYNGPTVVTIQSHKDGLYAEVIQVLRKHKLLTIYQRTERIIPLGSIIGNLKNVVTWKKVNILAKNRDHISLYNQSKETSSSIVVNETKEDVNVTKQSVEPIHIEDDEEKDTTSKPNASRRLLEACFREAGQEIIEDAFKPIKKKTYYASSNPIQQSYNMKSYIDIADEITNKKCEKRKPDDDLSYDEKRPKKSKHDHIPKKVNLDVNPSNLTSEECRMLSNVIRKVDVNAGRGKKHIIIDPMEFYHNEKIIEQLKGNPKFFVNIIQSKDIYIDKLGKAFPLSDEMLLISWKI